MAQTIKIKRSTGSSAPSSLANGELAYLNNATHKKLYIGRPGGDTGDIDVIGGKDFVDLADGALPKSGGVMTGDITGNGTVYGRAMATDGVKLDGIEAGADVTDATNVEAALGAFDISLADNVKAKFGDSNDLQIYHDGSASYISEVGTGNLKIMGSDLEMKSTSNEMYLDATQNGVLRLYCDNVVRLTTTGTGVTVNGNVTSPNFLGNATTATTATNVNLTNLANNSTDTGPKYLTFSDGNSGSQPLETQDLLYYNPDTAYLTTKNIEVQSGMITGPSVMTIDPNGEGASGELIIQGSLTVKGTTTTIDSNTLSVGDSLIVLNGDENGTPSENAGIEVERGTSGNVSLQWVESGTTSTSYWAVNDASGVSPYSYPILHTRNAHEQTYTIEGGSF